MQAAQLEENRQIILTKRPQGAVTTDCFEVDRSEVPVPQEGQALVQVLYVAIDPAIRNWIDARGAGYLPAVELGEPVRASGIGRVVASRSEKLPVGSLVTALTGWQAYAIVGSDMSDLPRFGSTLPEGMDPLQAVSIFGQSATTAYAGVERAAQPAEGETLLVSSAASSVGSLVGQIARLRGARVIGIAGSDEKCRWVTEDLGFEACINYRTEDLAARLKSLAPRGVDVFFDNVGGEQLDTVLRRIAFKGRVVLCGTLATDDTAEPYRLRHWDRLMSRRGTMTGFNVLDHWDIYPEAIKQVGEWVASGRIQYRTHVLEGLESAPEGLLRLFRGDHLGKLVVHVSD